MKYLNKIEYVRKATYPGYYEAGIRYRNKVLRGVITDMPLIDAWKDHSIDKGSRKAATLARRIYTLVREQNPQRPREKFRVRNIYGIQGESIHRTASAACKAARKREGDGWIVEDNYGCRVTVCADGSIFYDVPYRELA